MRKKIFILRCKILKHKFISFFYKKIAYILLYPLVVIYSIIIGIYGVGKGLTKDEILEKYFYKRFKIKNHY